MHTAKLRKVGGSVMLSVPPAFLEQLQVQTGTTVGLKIDRGKLIIEPLSKPRYTLAELLAASDYSQMPSAEDVEWINSAAAGRELL